MELVERLIAAGEAERKQLLREHDAAAAVPLAQALKDICRNSWNSDPARVIAASEALNLLTQIRPDPEVKALADWGVGIAALAKSEMEVAIFHLDQAAESFCHLNQPHAAASTQISKLMALAILGRYDEAIECGLEARAVFVAQGDVLEAGLIDHNIGNIHWRRDRYAEAEYFLSAACERYLSVNAEKQLAVVEYCLAYIKFLKHDFHAAEEFYALAWKHAEENGLTATQADIEVGLGALALVRGQFDEALRLLESARRRYAGLEMPYQSAITEQEIADAYLELNLVPEAVELYARLEPELARLGARGERARALEYQGRALVQLNQTEQAAVLLKQARTLYSEEGNAVGAAMVTLTEAQLQYSQGQYAAACLAAEAAEKPLAAAGAWRRWLTVRWLHGEAKRALESYDEALSILEDTLREAEAQEQPQVAHRCQTSLGLLHLACGRRKTAETIFQRAARIIEDLRAPLPAEEFRAAFFADKLTPYEQLASLCLAEGRVAESFGYVEKARARVLQDMMGGEQAVTEAGQDDFERSQMARLQELRAELNWFYNRINRPLESDAGRSPATLAALRQSVRERERETLELTRQLEHRGQQTTERIEQFALAELQNSLGADMALVEYAFLNKECLAFIVTNESIEVARGLGSEAELQAVIEQFYFQINALRHGPAHLRAHLPQLTQRARHYLATLYDALLRPLETRLGLRRLVVVPQRALHYVPFHALHDGAEYVIERREVSYAPSGGVLLRCLTDRPRRPLERAVLCGAPDELTPHLRDEILALAPLFPKSVVLLDADATLDAIRAHAPTADVLHLACHGQFRPDNPLFSALKLADGWFTVRDAGALRLQAELVTLSACETGVNAVAPGDEIIGLARGFFAAGAPSLVLSLWAVDDDATAELMTKFYQGLQSGLTTAAALRDAQCAMLKQYPHPFFWSPFILLGR